MAFIEGKYNGRTIYINSKNIMAIGQHQTYPDTKTWIDGIDREEYVLDIPIDAVLKQIPEGD